MTRKLSDVLKHLKKRARAAGPQHVATFEALDAHYNQVAKDLSELRKQRGLTQSELARRTGLPQSEISRTLSGRTASPRIDTVQRLASGLDAELRVIAREAASRRTRAKTPRVPRRPTR